MKFIILLLIPLFVFGGFRSDGYRTGKNAGRTSTLVIAASNSSQDGKNEADYVCDGTNDQVEIQAAIDKLSSGGGEVRCLEGLYSIEITYGTNDYGILIKEDTNIVLSGCGSGTIFRADSTDSTFDGALILIRDCQSITIRDLQVDGNFTTNREVCGGIIAVGSNLITIEKCLIYDTGNHPIGIYGTTNSVVNNNYLESITGHTVHSSHGLDIDREVGGVGTENLIISNNYITAPGSDQQASKIENSRLITYIGNTFFNSTVLVHNNDGGSALLCGDIIYTGNLFNKSFLYLRTRTDPIIITGNTFTGNVLNGLGISITDSSGPVTITGNIFDSLARGIEIAATDNDTVIIMNNIFHNISGDAIDSDSDPRTLWIHGNQCAGSLFDATTRANAKWTTIDTTSGNFVLIGDADIGGDIYADSLLVKILATVKDGPTGYATVFVDTTGTDSLIIMVGSTRRGIAIE